MSNLLLWEKVRAVPAEAKKKITGGRINGMTDINPTWRQKCLTENFGICGIGWKYVITDKRLEKGGNNEISAFVDIDLFIKVDGQWSDAIPGTGGSSFVTNESKGLYTSDECFKMALTDAISVSCKALGIGADVYFEKDATKYTQPEPKTGERPQETTQQALTEPQLKRLYAIAKAAGKTMDDVKVVILHDFNKSTVESLSKEEYEKICERLQAAKPKANV